MGREFNMLSNYLLLLVMAMSFAQVDLCCPRNNRVSRNNNDNNRVSRNNNDNNRMSQNNNNRLFCRPRPPSQSRCCNWRHSYSYAPTRICWSLPLCRNCGTCTCIRNCGRKGKSLASEAEGRNSKKVVDSNGRQFLVNTN